MAKTITKETSIPVYLNGFFHQMTLSPLDILKSYAINHTLGKIQKYGTEGQLFAAKYHCSFDQFKKRLNTMKDKENFEWEDDFLDWEFSVENLKTWKKKLLELTSHGSSS
jgi:hypothetical protein